jgi:cell fate regulator YaaT (PSP1 superfamily)
VFDNIDRQFVGNDISVQNQNSDQDLTPRIIESILISTIKARHNNVSSCFCSCPYFKDSLLDDNRRIIEVVCNGLLSCNYCEMPKDFEQEILPEDFIIVQHGDCHEIAQVKLVGELVKLKRRYLGYYGEELPKIQRKATNDDLERVKKNLHDEERATPIFRKSMEKFNLNMKLVSIHYQFDRKKLFFFYTADGRVDFRELAKELASEFKTRIELRQIGVRDEAKKVGGVGTCGREYCCISFLSSFKRITTQLANEQNLLSSMGKLSGPCGKLKCCLSFEVE